MMATFADAGMITRYLSLFLFERVRKNGSIASRGNGDFLKSSFALRHASLMLTRVMDGPWIATHGNPQVTLPDDRIRPDT